jgi:RND family efflux transporter MFP subunit
MSEAGQPRTKRRWLNVFLNIVLSLAILAGSAAAVWRIYSTEPTAQQIKTKRKSAALVETLAVERGTYSPQLAVLGTVRPVQDILLSPQVRGQVIKLSPSFVPGGMVRKGDLLLQIDPADFENAVSVRQSELEQVEANWEIEEGRRKLAKQELELLGDSISGINRSLVLREPQSASLKSQLRAAKAAVERAELDLKRTQLIAPFDAQVLRRSVNVGSQVGQGDELGQLVGVDQYWVIAAIPVRNLRWVKFPSEKQTGSMALLSNPDAWGSETTRQGRVARMIGALDQQTRLARVVITVDDPLGKNSQDPPLILDTLIEVEIDGVAIENIVRLDREHVHDGDTVWVKQDNELEIRKTKIVFRDAKYAYIREGLESGDEVVTTTLATVANGVKLRRIDEQIAEPSKSASEKTE